MNVVTKVEERFEFVLYLNKHIICQRYFSINDFNEDSVYSLEIKDLMDDIMGMGTDVRSMGLIPKQFKAKSMEAMWRNYNPYQPKNDAPKNLFEKEDVLDFEVRVDKRVVAQTSLSGNYFPHQIRYQVDIKELIPSIKKLIKDTLSQKNYTFDYADVEL